MTTPAQEPTEIYVTRITVKLRKWAGVPFDMMRYDACVPDTEADAYKLGRIADSGDDESDRTVTFRRYARNPGPPTEARWSGKFGCEIVSWEPIP